MFLTPYQGQGIEILSFQFKTHGVTVPLGWNRFQLENIPVHVYHKITLMWKNTDRWILWRITYTYSQKGGYNLIRLYILS